MFKFRSYAKLNLYLEIIGRREDGYHNILTVFQLIDLYDEIIINLTDNKISVGCSNPEVPSGEGNLVYKAVEAFQEKTRIKKGIDVFISKHIPVGGGLGGGSSNAATTLMALNRIFNRPLNMLEIKKICDDLGSDTSFFLYGGTILAQGRGERILEIIPTPEMDFLVYCPDFSVNTGKAYNAVFNGLTKPTGNVKFLIEGLKEKDKEKIGRNLFNHFTPLLLEKEEVKGVLELLSIVEGVKGVSITGSGSCVFALLDRRDVAGRLLPRVQNRRRCWICRSISSSEYVEQFNQMED